MAGKLGNRAAAEQVRCHLSETRLRIQAKAACR